MTQPPDQPPQGGYGTPQDPRQQPPGPAGPPPPVPPQQPPGPPPGTPPPPAPGPPPPPPAQGPGAPPPPPAGAPGTPPPGPGYGYPPQQPVADNPYAATAPYGQPQQPYGQAPYGQQQPGPYGQQPYGYPPQQYPGAPTPPGGGKPSPFKGKPAIITAAAVVVAVLVAGTVWAVTGSDDGDKKPVAHDSKKPVADAPVDPGDGSGDGDGGDDDFNAGRKPGEAKVLWYKEAPDAPGSGAGAPGMWITDKIAVKAAYKQVFAFRVADGKPAWKTLDLPQKICAVTPQATDDGKVVIAYEKGTGDKSSCSQLLQLDLATGETGWTKPLPKEGLFDIQTSIEMAISGNTVAVSRLSTVSAFKVSDGSKVFGNTRTGADCRPDGFAGGAKLIAAETCGTGTDTEAVAEIDPTTGKAEWTKKFPKGWRVRRVYSLDPLVVYLTNEDKKQWNISVVDKGATRSQVSSSDSFAPDCGLALLERALQGCTGTTADDTYLYLPTDTKSGANEVVAFNLNTGKEGWRAKSPSDSAMLPLRVENGELIAYVKPTYNTGGTVVSIPTSGSHASKPLLQMPDSTASIENSFFSKVIDYVDGRFYISTTRLTGNDDAKEKLMLAYGK